jgi:hypothetical protein
LPIAPAGDAYAIFRPNETPMLEPLPQVPHRNANRR